MASTTSTTLDKTSLATMLDSAARIMDTRYNVPSTQFLQDLLKLTLLIVEERTKRSWDLPEVPLAELQVQAEAAPEPAPAKEKKPRKPRAKKTDPAPVPEPEVKAEEVVVPTTPEPAPVPEPAAPVKEKKPRKPRAKKEDAKPEPEPEAAGPAPGLQPTLIAHSDDEEKAEPQPAIPAKEKKPRAKKAEEPKAEEPKAAANVDKLNPTQVKHLKKLGDELKVEITPERKREFINYVNGIGAASFGAKPLTEHMRSFLEPLAPKPQSEAVAPEPAASSDDDEAVEVEFEGKTYFVDKQGSVYEPQNGVDVVVGKVGMAAFAKMAMPKF